MNVNILGIIIALNFLLSDDKGFNKNIIIFGADMSSSGHINNRTKDILIFGKGPTQ